MKLKLTKEVFIEEVKDVVSVLNFPFYVKMSEEEFISKLNFDILYSYYEEDFEVYGDDVNYDIVVEVLNDFVENFLK